jgi:hypothetical protein
MSSFKKKRKVFYIFRKEFTLKFIPSHLLRPCIERAMINIIQLATRCNVMLQ